MVSVPRNSESPQDRQPKLTHTVVTYIELHLYDDGTIGWHLRHDGHQYSAKQPVVNDDPFTAQVWNCLISDYVAMKEYAANQQASADSEGGA